MTGSKARPHDVNHRTVNALQTYLTSLLYLRQEAKRDGLPVVARIMWQALAEIEEWLDTGKAPVSVHEILDSPLCRSLDFLLRWMALSPAKQQEVAQNIARYELETNAGDAMLRSRSRVSRKTIN
jgi:hypothetical protein